MKNISKHAILISTKRLFALHGYEGFSVRLLVKDSGVGLSSIYHYFGDKDEILREVFTRTNKELGIARALLPAERTASAMLRQRIAFQFEHIESIIFVLKYYLHFRPVFLKQPNGYLPAKAYLHIEEVLQAGVANGEFGIPSTHIEENAKVIAHAINGYLLEYYPARPTSEELDQVISAIHTFLIRSLTNGRVMMS